MAESEENTRETQVSQEGGTEVVRERTSTASTEETRLTAANGIWFVAGLIEVLLAFRMILKLFGANPESGFVDFVYAVSNMFVAPFNGIFSTPTGEGDIVTSIFEPGTLVAMVVYALIAWGLVKLVNLNQRS